MTYRSEFLLVPPVDPDAIPVPDRKLGEAWVYYHIAADGQVLYIGCTIDPRSRTGQHETTSAWFADVAKMVWFGPMDEVNARAVERELITVEQPPNNVRHTDREVNARQSPEVKLRGIRKRIERLTEQLDRAREAEKRYAAQVGVPA